MIYLVFSILCMTALAMVFRRGSDRGADGMGMNIALRAWMGLMGTAVLLAATAAWRPGELTVAIRSVAAPAALAAVFYWLSGLTLIHAIHYGHLGITYTVIRLAMVLPTIASVVFWREVVLWPISAELGGKAAGVLLACGSIVLISFGRRGGDRSAPSPPMPPGPDAAATAAPTPPPHRRGGRRWVLWLAAAFLMMGSWETSLRVAGGLESEIERVAFIEMIFVFSGLFSMPALLIFRPKLRRRELFYGLLAALSAMGGSGLRPWALRDLGGVIVFPVTAIAVTVLILLASRAIWRERMNRWSAAGVVVALAAIALLTIRW
jgi:hypothetical protein